MDVYKLTYLREINKPRLSIYQPYLELVTFVKAVNYRHASGIAKDVMKEHNFSGYEVEALKKDEFKVLVNLFIDDDKEKI